MSFTALLGCGVNNIQTGVDTKECGDGVVALKLSSVIAKNNICDIQQAKACLYTKFDRCLDALSRKYNKHAGEDISVGLDPLFNNTSISPLTYPSYPFLTRTVKTLGFNKASNQIVARLKICEWSTVPEEERIAQITFYAKVLNETKNLDKVFKNLNKCFKWLSSPNIKYSSFLNVEQSGAFCAINLDFLKSMCSVIVPFFSFNRGVSI